MRFEAQKIALQQAATRRVTFTLRNAAGSLVNLTGYSFKLVVKEHFADADAAALVNLDPAGTTPTSGVVFFDAAPTAQAPAAVAELRVWKTGVPVTSPPSDRKLFRAEVQPKLAG